MSDCLPHFACGGQHFLHHLIECFVIDSLWLRRIRLPVLQEIIGYDVLEVALLAFPIELGLASNVKSIAASIRLPSEIVELILGRVDRFVRTAGRVMVIRMLPTAILTGCHLFQLLLP